MSIVEQLLLALWIFFPAGFANMAPVFGRFIPIVKQWDYPLDAGHHFRGKRLFGANKTVRGLVAGFIFALAAVFAQKTIFDNCDLCMAQAPWYGDLQPIVLALLFTLGALGGDAIESFAKRQRGFAPGSRWVPFDQLDYIAGALLATSFYVNYTLLTIIAIVVVFFGLHVAATYIAYHLGLKDSPL